ncbi:hypothetical protein Amal_03714 [Acetobacter malorum]|uniref:Uncharacterized protein n=1 Tax=Acetobacter malorum TaxID=178901 RepID=A0A177G442_9PROT|nr:hypothetical protein Amal_03714 [Acetobacter malorum]
MDKAGNKRRGQTFWFNERQNFLDREFFVFTGFFKFVGKKVGCAPTVIIFDNGVSCAAQIFNQYNPQGNGDSPEFSDCEGSHALIGEQIAAKDVLMQVAVSMCDKSPCYTKDPW